MKKKWIISVILVSIAILYAKDFKLVMPNKENEKNRADTLATINSFSHLGEFHTLNYSGDYEEILDYLDNLYVGGQNQLSGDLGCSLYSGTGNLENIFMGRNFDNPQQDVLVGKYSSPGCYESIALNRLADLGIPLGSDFDNLTEAQELLLLRSPYFAADGFNSMGVAAGLAYVQEVDVQVDPDKETIFITRWVREILDHAANVEEAVEISNNYNILDNMSGNNTLCHHLLVTDASGNSVILEYHNGQFQVIEPDVEWQILTNTPIYNVPLQIIFSQCYRYELLYNTLESQNGEISDWRNGLDILELPTWGNITNGTQWSNLFDLSDNLMYLSLYRDFQNIVQVDIENFEFTNYGNIYIYDQYEVDENNNNLIEPGESVDLILFLTTDFITTGVSGTITCSNPDIILNSDTIYFGDINPDEIVMNINDPFEIEIAEDATPQNVTVNVSFETDYDYTFDSVINFFVVSSSSIDEEVSDTSTNDYQMHNYPNPFNPSTTIYLDSTNLQKNSRIEIYNMKGQKIKQYPVMNEQSVIVWDGKDTEGKQASSGIYFYSWKTDKTLLKSKRMVLMK